MRVWGCQPSLEHAAHHNAKIASLSTGEVCSLTAGVYASKLTMASGATFARLKALALSKVGRAARRPRPPPTILVAARVASPASA